jgi:prevent-host-death family protein
MSEVGARQLRADLAAHLRRAAGGERVTVTVDGVPVATLGPASADLEPLTALVASGAVRAPRRHGSPRVPVEPLSTMSTVRPETLLRGVR